MQLGKLMYFTILFIQFNKNNNDKWKYTFFV